MHTDLSHQETVSIESLDSDCDGLHSCFLARLIIDQYGTIAMLLRPTEIHAQQHLGPILRFSPPCPRVNGKKCIALGVLTAQERGSFNASQFVFESAQLLLNVFSN